MSSPIKQSDIYDLNLYAPLIKDNQTLLEQYEKLGKALKDDAALLVKRINELNTTTAAGIQKLSQYEAESSKIVASKNIIDKEQLKIKKQLDAATDEEVKGKLRLQKINKEQRDILKDQLILEDKEAGTLEKLNAQNRVLARERAKVNITTKEGKKAVQDINTQIDKNNKLILKNSDELKGNRLQVGGYKRALEGVKGVLASLGLAFGAFAIVRDAFNIGKDFEASIASLSAITGATGDTLEEFKGKVIDVATNTKKSATEVAKAFELIGSAKPELLANADALALVTEQAIILSQATGLDLDVSASALTNTLNQFSLGAEKAAEVVNILAAGSQAGAAPVNEINEALSKFGTVAASSGVGVNESVAAIEVLAEKSIVGANAGTALRNVLTTLSVVDALPEKAQKQLQKYGVDTSVVSDKTLSLSERLKELSKISGDQTALFEVFGKENLVAGQILLDSTGKLDGYTRAVTDTNTATEQAAINQDTLSAVIEQLKAAWEAVVIKFSEGSGVLDVLKGILKFLANNLEAVITVVAKAVSIFGVYQAATKLASIAQSLFASSTAVATTALSAETKAVIQDTTAKEANATATKGSAKNFGLWAAAAALVVFALIDIGKELFGMTSAQKALNEVTEEVNKKVAEEKTKLLELGQALNDTNAGTKERQQLLDEINSTYGTHLQNLDDEAAFLRQIEKAYKDIINEMTRKAEIEALTALITETTKRKFELEANIDNLSLSELVEASKIEGDLLEFQNRLITIQNEIRNETGVRGGAGQIKSKSNGKEEVITPEGPGGKNIKIETEEQRNLDFLAFLRKQNEENRKIFESNALNEGKSLKEVNALLAQERLEDLKQESKVALQLFGEFSQEYVQANIEYQKALRQTTAEGSEENQKSQLELNQQLFDDLQNQNEENLKKLETNLLKEGVTREEIDRQLSEKRIENLKGELEFTLQNFGDFSKEYLEKDLELQKALEKQDEDASKKQAEIQKALFETLEKSLDTFINLLEKAFDRTNEKLDEQIALIGEEIQGSKDRQKQLEDEAKENGLNADESIQAERDKQKRLLDDQKALQRKKEQIESFLTALKLVQTLVDQGQSVSNAVSQTKSDLGGLKGFTDGLAGFHEGTNTTVGDALGYSYISGDKDTHVIKAHKDEMIIGRENMRGIKGMTQDEVVEGAMMLKNGLLYQTSKISNMYTTTGGPSAYINGGISNQKLDKIIVSLESLPEKMPSLTGVYDPIADYFTYKEKTANLTKTVRIKGRN